MLDTLPYLEQRNFPALKRRSVTALQVNLGYLCNQQCQHCHVDAGPRREEMMSDAVLEQVKDYLGAGRSSTLDLTGGAPEMHPRFRELVAYARAQGMRVIDRCNLSILTEPGYQDLATFLAENSVEVVASLPCYLEENVDGQRGKGVYAKSIEGLKSLNALGYGHEADKVLNLVYNPVGPYLPPAQVALQEDYRRELSQRFGIAFNSLLTITNMPIKRFGSQLLSTRQFDDYMQTLVQSYQGSNLDGVMCRDLISVDWRGYLYDCDFNQMLGLPLGSRDGDSQGLHIAELQRIDLTGHPIVVRDHCYGCTAGQGSSCGGALS